MTTVGEQLRQAREARNLTVYQVAEVTKIRTDHIRALDEGNYDVFSAPVYIRGFVRSYASAVKADVPRVLELLNQELGKSAKHHEPPPLSQRQRSVLDVLMFQLSKLQWRKVWPVLAVTVLVVAGVLAYKVWSSHKGKNPLAGLKPGVYQAGQKGGGETLPLPGRR